MQKNFGKIKEEKMEKGKLSLMVDYAFKRVFAQEDNSTILKDFLEAILNIEIEDIEIKNPEIPKDMKDSKIGILDIKAKINDNIIINIEMQVVNQKNIDKRSAFYMSKIHAEGLKAGEDYSCKNKTIVINILNFNYYKRNAYHSVAKMKFEEIKEKEYVDMQYEEQTDIATNDLEMHFIELPKFIKKNPNVETKLEQWLWLIIGEGEKIEMAKEKNEKVKKADEILDKLSQNKEERELYELRLKAILDEENIRQSGKEEGEKDASLKIAKNMLSLGIDIELIAKATNLSIEEIQKLS